ncbi:MAG: hypothetical protein K0S94_2808 [Nitrospira sp.]|jgi:hypothetical protein|nr:hypothetical protein [Nitrospira sp.]
MPYTTNIDDLLARVGFPSIDTRRQDCLENIPTSYEGDRHLVATLDTILELLDEQHAMLRALLLIHGRDVSSKPAPDTSE